MVTPIPGNTTYSVKTTRQGHVLFKVWVTASPHIADYVRIRAGYAIIPSLAVVHLGATVCFSTHLTEDQPGVWSVGKEGVLALEAATGIGKAMAVGRSVVYHKIKGVTDTHTEITVAKLESVVFNVTDANALRVFTNGRRRTEAGDYLVPVEFLLSNNETFTPLHTSPNKECQNRTQSLAEGVAPPTTPGSFIQQVFFSCLLDLWDSTGTDIMVTLYLAAQPVFDRSTGRSYCKLLPQANSARELSGRQDFMLSLRATAFDSLETYSVMSEVLSVPFQPAFTLGRKEVVLSEEDSTTEVVVNGNPKQLQSLMVYSVIISTS